MSNETADTPAHRKRWRLLEAPPGADVNHLEEETGLPRAACYLMAQRGLTDVPTARTYLAPRLDALHDPFEMKGLAELVDRLVAARERGAHIGIHGDYDVDGLASTTLYTLVLRTLGFEVTPFVPHRMIDGYGVSGRALEDFSEAGVGVLLTCDTGVGAHEEVRRAREEHGFEVLITDHHLPGEKLPPADVLVDPYQPGCSYPFKGLCAAGIAFKVLEGLCERLGRKPEEVLYPHLDLVGLGTVCDVVPLTSENRVLAHWGLKVARKTRNVGLRALYEAIDLQPYDVDEWKFGWVIGPRLNAVGRIDDAGKGLELLTTGDPEAARELAAEIDALNHQRKDLSDAIEEDAVGRVDTMDLEDVYGLALFGEEGGDGPEWHHGVLGIVASRLVERYGRPVFLFARDEETGSWKGSGRAPSHVENVHLRDMLTACRDHLAAFGGHAAAAGATLEGTSAEACAAFAAAFDAAAREQMDPEDRHPVLEAHLEVSLEMITQDVYDILRRFSPYGHENEEVTMIARGVRVTAARRIGRGQTHVKLQLDQDGARFEAIGWNLAEELPASVDTPTPYEADIAFRVHENTYRGRTALQLVLRDLRVKKSAEDLTLDAIAGRETEDPSRKPENLFA